MPLAKLWATMEAGNKVATQCSNLCYPDKDRHNIGVSQIMDVMDNAMEQALLTISTKHAILLRMLSDNLVCTQHGPQTETFRAPARHPPGA